jgi:SAM-dependent methyltransferase
METAQRTQFLREYELVRHAEGRGSSNAAYYLELPYRDVSGHNTEQWKIRSRSFSYLERRILPALERKMDRRLDILDLGAGNCWMSHRLAARGHKPVAIDIFSDDDDGLRAARHYPARFPVVEAEFDHIPVRNGSFDLAVFNASIHYSADLKTTLMAAAACLRPEGRILIVDSPIYARPEHGERMRAERMARFEKQYGFRSDALRSREYLDQPLLVDLARFLGLTWRVHRVWYGWQWWFRPIKAWALRRRPPSQFCILEGRFSRA